MDKIFQNDGPGYSVKVLIRSLNTSEPEKSSVIFESGQSRYNSKKTVDIKNLGSDFELTLNEVPGDYEIRYLVTGVKDSLGKHTPKNITEFKGQITLGLNGLGIPRLEKVEMILKENRTEYDIKKVNVTNETTGENVTVEEKVPRYSQHTIKESLLVTKSFENAATLDSNATLFAESKALLEALSNREELARILSQKKNQIETLVYTLRDMPEDSRAKVYLGDLDIQNFIAKADELAEYIESDAFFTAGISDLDAKLRESEGVMSNYTYRKKEHEERDKLIPLTHDYFKNVTENMLNFTISRPWVPAQKIEDFMKVFNETQQWALDLFAKQEAHPLNENPILAMKDLGSKMMELDNLLKKLTSIKKPVPPKNTTKTDKGKKDGFKLDSEILKNLNLTKEEIDEYLKRYKLDDLPDFDAETPAKDEPETATPEKNEGQSQDDAKPQDGSKNDDASAKSGKQEGENEEKKTEGGPTKDSEL